MGGGAGVTPQAVRTEEALQLTLPPITHETLIDYAEASGDHNPLHVDPVVAQRAGEPDVIAHGMLMMAYLGRLATQLFPQSALAAWHVRFTAKTPVGAVPTCHARVLERTGELVRAEVWAALGDGIVVTRGEAVFTIRGSQDAHEH